MNPKILEKIKHCLALSKSSNEHEAATALRQAHALMQKYGLSEDDMTALEIEIAGSQTIVAMKPPIYQMALARVVAEVFGCRPVAKVVMIKGSLKKADKNAQKLRQTPQKHPKPHGLGCFFDIFFKNMLEK